MVLQNGFSYYLFSTKFKYETYFLKMKNKDYNTLKIFIFEILDRVENFRELNGTLMINNFLELCNDKNGKKETSCFPD